MFYADLTPYEYGYELPQGSILNVGWLGRGHVFPVGRVPDGFVDALRKLLASRVNLYRGYHTCEFCPEPPVVVSSTGQRIHSAPDETMGNGEIRVVGSRGRVYVAPVLIAHYIQAHHYAPPAVFIHAVMSAVTSD